MEDIIIGMTILYGYPAGSLKCLCSLVDEEGAEATALKKRVGTAREGAGYDTSIGEETLVDGVFQFGSTLLESCYLLMAVLTVALARIIELAYGAAYAPQLVVERMALEAALVGVIEHAVGHPGWVAYAQDVHATLGEFLADPVNRHIALCTNKHLNFAA